MTQIRIVSWNVNGIRACGRNGFVKWLESERPDILCLQETKAFREQVDPEVREPSGYGSAWHSAKRPGYSGVATFFRGSCEPLEVSAMGISEFDDEGRVQAVEYPGFMLINAYFPNSQPERKRLPYKLAFNDKLRKHCNKLKKAGKHIIICGDFNCAHEEIDLARPKANRDNPGFYPEECASLTSYARAGYVDTFRHFHPDEPGHYSWWSYRAQARQKDIGWRLDYHWVNKEFLPQVTEAVIRKEVMGSDHCPVGITVSV